MRMLASAAAAALFALSAAGVYAQPLEDQPEIVIDVPVAAPVPGLFDLGVDLSQVSNTRADVARYLASVPSETRGVLVATCNHYMADSSSVQDTQTLVFCNLAVN